MRGRPKQPTAIAKQKGTFKPSRYQEGVDSKLHFIFNKIPEPPQHLGEVGKQTWIKLLSSAQKINGYISVIDLPIFTTLCQLQEEIDYINSLQPPLFITHHSGNQVPNPQHKYLRELRKDFLEISREFGMTPASRSKIKITPAPEPNTEPVFIL
jgi:P27 family predicted phage terminase small subunit